MNVDFTKGSKFLLVTVCIAVALKLVVGFPIINSALIIAGAIFISHLVVFDEDLPGGWSNPDGNEPVPYAVLAIKGIVFFALLLLKFVLGG